MSPALPVVSGRDAVKAFSRIGFVLQPGRGKGSHMVLVRMQPPAVLTVPDHRELRRGTLRALIRDAGISVDGFVELL
jgi:predicted RNA binding protein YcfA (HicA-like mRNA interferase family)